MILGGVREEVDDFLYFPFTLMEPGYVFEFDTDVFGHLKVFCFVEASPEPLADVLGIGALVNECQNDDEGNDIKD